MLRVAVDQRRASGQFGQRALSLAVIQRQGVVLGRLDQPLPLQLVQHVGHLLRRDRAPASSPCCRRTAPRHPHRKATHLLPDHQPRRAVLGDRAPALVVDAAVAEHLEVLHVVALGFIGLVEAVQHAGAFHRRLRHAVDGDRLGQAGRFQDGRGNIDHVAELRAQAALLLNALRPVHDGAVARAAPVRGHLLGPLVGRVHRPGPAHRVVVVRLGRAELVHLREHEFGRLQRGHAVEVGHLVERAVQRAFGDAPLSPMMT